MTSYLHKDHLPPWLSLKFRSTNKQNSQSNLTRPHSLSLSLYFYLSLRRHGTEAHSVTHTLRLWPVRVSESISLSLSLSLSLNGQNWVPAFQRNSYKVGSYVPHWRRHSSRLYHEAERSTSNCVHKEYVVNPSRCFVLKSDLERWFGTTGICAMWLFVIIEIPLSYRRV